MGRSLLSLAEMSDTELHRIVDRSAALASGAAVSASLQGRAVGIYFRKTSTRTRTSFSLAALKLGAHVLSYGPHDLQLLTGESTADTGRVLSQYLDALVVRTAGDPLELREMATGSTLAIVNAMTADEHPTQALSDLATIKQRFGQLDDVALLYVGEGNNTAAALAYGLATCRGCRATFATPPGYGLAASVLARAQAIGAGHGVTLQETHDIGAIDGRFDVIYTTRWETTGTVKSDAAWRERFAPFRVSAALMAEVSTAESVFMHDLPAVRGDECASSVLDGDRSIVWAQARQKLYSAMAVLEWCLA
jgi:ornithine carbamoyltransferase